MAKPPKEIKLYDIVRIMDGALLEINLASSGFSGKKVKDVWGEVAEAMKEKTLGYSLESFLPEESETMYYI